MANPLGGKLLLSVAYGACVLAALLFRGLAGVEVERARPLRGRLHAIAFRWHEGGSPRARRYRHVALSLTAVFCALAALFVVTFTR